MTKTKPRAKFEKTFNNYTFQIPQQKPLADDGGGLLLPSIVLRCKSCNKFISFKKLLVAEKFNCPHCNISLKDGK
jgi:hypothetical protein